MKMDNSSQNNLQNGEKTRIGLLAAWGDYPVEVARALQQTGHTVYCLGLKGHANRKALEPLCNSYQSIGIGRLGTAIRYFKRHQICRATMAGKFHKTLLYRPWVLVPSSA